LTLLDQNLQLMNNLILYRIISYFLLAIAVILGIASLFVLLIAFTNPALLLSVFVIVAVVIYSVASFLFLLNGLDGKRQQQSKLRDWIKVNAYVAIVFVVMNIVQSIAVLQNPAVLSEAVNQFSTEQTTKSPLPTALMVKAMKGLLWFLLFYAITLGVHIVLTFRYLKQHAHLFGDKTSVSSND
jgi:heme exporter protein D